MIYQKLIIFFTWLLIAAIPTTQTHALQQTTNVEVSVALGDMSRLLDQMDLNNKDLVSEDALITSDLKHARVLKRLEKRIPRALRSIDKQVAHLSDAQVEFELTRNGEISRDSNNNRTKLASVYKTSVIESLPHVAHEIVKAGGIRSYLKAAKLDRTPADTDPNFSWKKATIGTVITVAVLFVLSLFFGWAAVLIGYFSVGFVAVIGLIIYKNNHD